MPKMGKKHLRALKERDQGILLFLLNYFLHSGVMGLYDVPVYDRTLWRLWSSIRLFHVPCTVWLMYGRTEEERNVVGIWG